MSEQKPGRYARTTNGLIASMVVIVVVVVGFVLVRSLITDDPDVKPQRIDYLATVSELQQGGFDPVYPAKLPSTWQATNYDYQPDTVPQWGLSLLTGAGRYIGVEESGDDVSTLLTTYVDPHPSRASGYRAPGASVATGWDGWSDSGGDHAFSASLGQENVVVFGSASVAELQGVVDSLTTAKLTSLGPTPTPGATQSF